MKMIWEIFKSSVLFLLLALMLLDYTTINVIVFWSWGILLEVWNLQDIIKEKENARS